MVEPLSFLVRFIHILAGVLWIGGAAYMGLVVARTLMTKAPPQVAGPAMGVLGPAGFKYLSWAGAVTIVFGVWNQFLIQGGTLDYRSNTWAVLMGASLFIAIGMMGIAGGVIGRSIRQLKALAPKPGSPAGPPPPQVVAIQKRMMLASMVNVLLGISAVVLMVWATQIRLPAL